MMSLKWTFCNQTSNMLPNNLKQDFHCGHLAVTMSHIDL